MAGWQNDIYYGDDGKPDWGITQGPERYKPGSPFGPGGQYATQDPLNPGAWYVDDPMTVGGMVHFDDQGTVLNTFSHGDARNDPRAEGGTGWNLKQLDEQGNPTQVFYPKEEGGLFGLGPVWGSLAGIGLVMGAGFGLAGAASLLGVAPGVIGVGGMGAVPAAGATAGTAGGISAALTPELYGLVPEIGLGAGLEGAGGALAAGTLPAAGGGIVGGSIYGAPIGPNLAGAAGAPALAGGGVVGGGGGLLGGGGVGSFLGNVGQYAPLIAAGTQGLGSIVGATVAGNAATRAAQIQADAARAANNAQMAIYEQNRADLAPYRAAGYGALQKLGDLVDQPVTLPEYTAYPTLQAQDFQWDPNQYNFQAPVGPLQAEEYAFKPPGGQQVLTDDPGYQFRVSEGLKALDRQASARGSLVSGGQLKAAQRFGQGLASQEYGAAYGRARDVNELRYGRALTQNEQTYNRALGENQLYTERALQGNQLLYNRAQQQNMTEAERKLQAQTANAQQTIGLRNMRYNELAGISGTGQTAATNIAQLGANVGQQIGNNLTSAGAAQAAGQVGAANAFAGGLQGVGNAANSYLNYALLSQYLQRGGGGGGTSARVPYSMYATDYAYA